MAQCLIPFKTTDKLNENIIWQCLQMSLLPSELSTGAQEDLRLIIRNLLRYPLSDALQSALNLLHEDKFP